MNVYSFYILFSTKERSVRLGILKDVTSVSLLKLRLSLRSVFHPYYMLNVFQSLMLLCSKFRDTRLGSADTDISQKNYNGSRRQASYLIDRCAQDT